MIIITVSMKNLTSGKYLAGRMGGWGSTSIGCEHERGVGFKVEKTYRCPPVLTSHSSSQRAGSLESDVEIVQYLMWEVWQRSAFSGCSPWPQLSTTV